MALTTSNYRFDYDTGQVFPNGTSTWSGLSGTTWANWTTWNYNYNSQIVYYSGPRGIGLTPRYFTLRIQTDSNSPITYEVYTSNTGAFAGEETKTTIEPGDTDISGFYGAYVVFAVIANSAGLPPQINSIQYQYSSVGEKELSYSQVNTSTLAGTSSSRTLSLGTNVGGIVDVKIQPYEVTAYNLDVYVTNTATSTYLIPKVISSTSSSLTFALVGVDNQPRNGTVDITLKTLPFQYMDGNNLTSN